MQKSTEKMTDSSQNVIVDASVLVDLLARTQRARAVVKRLDGMDLHAPAHVDSEVLSALGRMCRARTLATYDAGAGITRLTRMPIIRHPLTELVLGAWARRADMRLNDALYVELAERLDAPLITADLRLARAYPQAEPIT